MEMNELRMTDSRFSDGPTVYHFDSPREPSNNVKSVAHILTLSLSLSPSVNFSLLDLSSSLHPLPTQFCDSSLAWMMSCTVLLFASPDDQGVVGGGDAESVRSTDDEYE